MKNYKLLAVCLVFLISGFLIGQVVQADSKPEAGSEEDPLATISYVEEVAEKMAGEKGREFTGDTVIIATGEVPYDAQASSPLVTCYNGVLLLTPSHNLSSATEESLENLQPSKIFIIGGTGAISQEVEQQVRNISAEAEIVRVFGENRYETAVKIAQEATGKSW